jgi:hypothetical protein
MAETQVELFTPYPKQKEYLDRFIDTDDLFSVVISPRGSGKTLLAINSMLYWLLSSDNQRGGWLAPTFSQAKSVLDTIVESAKSLIVSSNRMEATISFINGSTIKFLSADSADNIRGYRFEYLVVDEAAFIKEMTITTTILPTLNPSGKKVLFISTPKGKNWLFNWYNKPDVVSFTFKLEECPYVNTDLVNEARKSLPPELFRQEFEGAFVDAANDVFQGVDLVATVSHYDTRKVDAYIGIDTGLSDDFSVLTIINPMGRVLMVETLNNRTLQEIAQRFKSTMSKYNIVGGYVEANGIGAAMADQIIPSFRRVKKFHMSQDSKTDMVRRLIEDIETKQIEIPTRELCPELHNEMGTFTYKLSTTGKLSFSHMNGAKDDHVDSLMLANYSRSKFMESRPIYVSGGSSNLRPTFG